MRCSPRLPSSAWSQPPELLPGGPGRRSLTPVVSLARRPPVAVDVVDLAASRMRDGLGSLLGVTAATAVPAGALVYSAPLWPVAARLPLSIAPPVLAVLIGLSGCLVVLADDGLGRRPPIGRALTEALRRLPAVIVLTVAGLIQIAVFTLFAVIPGVVRIGRLMPALPVLMLERVRPGVALRRSAFLTRNSEFMCIRAMIGAIVLAASLAAAPVSLLVVAIPLPAGGSASLAATRLLLGGIIAACTLIPAVAATLFAIFLVRREQLEALDLQLALQALDEATPARPRALGAGVTRVPA